MKAAALDSARAIYPLAAAYAQAEKYSFASNDAKSAAGTRAMRAIEAGADPIATAEEMMTEWSAAAEQAVRNA